MLTGRKQEIIRQCAEAGGVKWSTHATGEAAAEDLDQDQIIPALATGEIVEDYPGHHCQLPDCLVLRWLPDGLPSLPASAWTKPMAASSLLRFIVQQRRNGRMTGEQENRAKPCPLCNGPLHHQGAATVSFVVKGRVVVVRNAPAEVCDQCGQAFLSTGMSKRVSTIIKDALKHNMELSVVNLAGPATAAA